MFRLQSPDIIAPSGAGVGWRQRLGRADQVYARRKHLEAEVGQSQRLRCAGFLPVPAGARRFRPAQR